MWLIIDFILISGLSYYVFYNLSELVMIMVLAQGVAAARTLAQRRCK
jgi:hypothetical protein